MKTYERNLIRDFARGWNDAAMGRPPTRGCFAYVQGYRDSLRIGL
ncbi:hypothetical protein [Caballeronia novacaledonica]|uniref:Uncharacterized protein n=1 Tax=Caballeronia novacaledonica TaxID=1544861 RepID=A0AA37IF21_9BURK|nr:hypothetical protein [Caballeronia novacaledonica]GJH28163.1 hypothetical protein CBA19CS42_26625 [Caballeronia novacaledonica]